MAITKIANCPKYMDYEVPTTVALKNISAGATVGVPMTSDDYETVLMFKGNGTNASTITIYVGNGIQGAGEDLTISLGKDDTILVNVESGYFKFVSGEYKDCLKVKSTTACTVMAFVLPAGKHLA